MKRYLQERWKEGDLGGDPGRNGEMYFNPMIDLKLDYTTSVILKLLIK